MKKPVVTWKIAMQIVRRHNTMVFRMYFSVLALLLAWLCVCFRWQHDGVLAWQSYHPGLYHGFWQAWAMMRGAVLHSDLSQFLQVYRYYLYIALLLLYILVNFYCVKALFETKFDNFMLKLHVF